MAERYQRGNQNPYIEEEQTKQWPKEKVQMVKQRCTKRLFIDFVHHRCFKILPGHVSQSKLLVHGFLSHFLYLQT